MDLKEIVVSAPGKVILHGEHSVVYGKNALAACLDIRTYLTVSKTDEDIVKLNLPDIGIEISWPVAKILQIINDVDCNVISPREPSEDIRKRLYDLAGVKEDTSETKQLALVSFLHLFTSIANKDCLSHGIYISVNSELPPSAGLGSSAAYSTCLAASLLLMFGHIPIPSSSTGNNHSFAWSEPTHRDLINAWAFEAEKIIHGKPSGIDNSISTFGGALSFQSGNITPLKQVPNIQILLTNTKVPRSTKVLVAGVREKFNKFESMMSPILDSMHEISIKCQDIFNSIEKEPTEKQLDEICSLIDINQNLLAAIGVSHSSIEKIIAVTKERGLHTKLTGAGGGGCVFTLLPPGVKNEAIDEIISILSSQGFECWKTSFGGPGVAYHSEKKT